MAGSSVRSVINAVLLTPGFPAGEQQTSTLVSLQLFLKSMQKYHPEIAWTVVTLQYPFTSIPYDWHGIPVYPAGGTGRTANRIFRWIRGLRILYTLRRDHKADLLHAFWLTEAALLGALFSRLTGIPLLLTAMGQDVKKGNRYLPLLQCMRPETVLISEFQVRTLSSRNRLKVAGIIPFGVDPESYPRIPGGRSLDILGAGNLNRIKNYSEFLDVVEILIQDFPRIRCMIVGEGEEMAKLSSQISQRKLEGILSMAGPMEYEALQTLMGSARVFLHTSLFEGQGLVLTEALAAGMYVVCHPVGTAWSFKSPRLLTGDSAPELAGLVRKILALKAPDHSPLFVYSLEDMCRQYELIYRSLLKR
jgi:glycosyltransferase involved in cell wall biosynthesis